ncbi:MAG: RusA family crossover junction endodeoxyribonuclease [Nitrospirae bacterium]|nr:RusA family crossover junction endodeoxyribonuclease [Nitrospirota bacterium]
MRFVIFGEPASKANSRQIVFNKRTLKPQVIKSKKANQYLENFIFQCPKPKKPIESSVALTAHIYYASNRPDLDESIIMDGLQKARVLKNDRLITQKHIYKHIDRKNPRAEIKIEYLKNS